MIAAYSFLEKKNEHIKARAQNMSTRLLIDLSRSLSLSIYQKQEVTYSYIIYYAVQSSSSILISVPIFFFFRSYCKHILHT